MASLNPGKKVVSFRWDCSGRGSDVVGVTRAGSGRGKGSYPPAFINMCASGALQATLLCVFFFLLCRQGRASCAELCSQQPREKQLWCPAEVIWPPWACPSPGARCLSQHWGKTHSVAAWGYRRQNASYWDGCGVWKISSKAQERSSSFFWFSQTLCFHLNPLGGKVVWWPERLWFFRAGLLKSEHRIVFCQLLMKFELQRQ